MWNLMKMDLNTLQLKNKKNILILVLAPILLFKLIPKVALEQSIILLTYGFTFIISIYILGDENPESGYLINSLPISKSQVVVGKYLFIHLSLLFSLLYLTIYMILLKLLGIITINNLDFQYLQTAILLMIIIINIINISLSRPGFFTKLFYFILFNVGLRFLMDFKNNEYLVDFKINILLLASASIVISLLLSIGLYNKREFARR